MSRQFPPVRLVLLTLFQTSQNDEHTVGELVDVPPLIQNMQQCCPNVPLWGGRALCCVGCCALFFFSPLPYSCHLVLVGTQSIHHTAKAYHHLQCGTVSSPAFNRHFTWLKNKKTTTNHTRSLSSKVGFLLLSCLNPEAERITHNISHRFFPLSSWVGCCCDDRHRSIACCCWGLELSDAGLHALQYERGDGLFWWSNWERSCTCHVWGYHIYACGRAFRRRDEGAVC